MGKAIGLRIEKAIGLGIEIGIGRDNKKDGCPASAAAAEAPIPIHNPHVNPPRNYRKLCVWVCVCARKNSVRVYVCLPQGTGVGRGRRRGRDRAEAEQWKYIQQVWLRNLNNKWH